MIQSMFGTNNTDTMEAEQKISIQIHDYVNGIYRIVEDRKATWAEVRELKEKAISSVKIDWDNLPPSATHVVFYGELIDKNGDVWFAGIYMHGEAYDDTEFDRIFTAKDVGYVGAFHKRA